MKTPWWMYDVRHRVVDGESRILFRVRRVFLWWLAARTAALRVFGVSP